MRPPSTPLDVRYVLTDSARRCDSFLLKASSPWLSVWPWISTTIFGLSRSAAATSLSSGNETGLIVALLVSKYTVCLSSIFVSVTTTRLYFFGQPSGGTPGSSGHLSSASRMPSLSLSGSGQPSSSSKPSLSSASFGHLSTLSASPSWSLSGSGQPSSSSKPSWSSASFGHLSTLSASPSLSLSLSAQAC